MISSDKFYCLRFSRNVYSKEAIFSATYRYSDLFFVFIEEDNDAWVIEFRPREEGTKVPDGTLDSFKSELVDHQLRHEFEVSFRTLREMIVSKAFGRTG